MLGTFLLLALQQQPLSAKLAEQQPQSWGLMEIRVPAGVDSGLRIPVLTVKGARPGKTVAFVAGSHGTEYASIVAMQRLPERINAAKLTGTVIVVPLINVASIEQMTPHINPIDRKGMNASYPGDSTGTQSQRALYEINRQVVQLADVVVDLHGGDLDEDLRPYSYWFRTGRAAQDSAGKALALAFGLDHIIVTNLNPNGPARSLSTFALASGKTAFVAEAGRSGLVLDEDVNALIDGSLNVLAALGMLERRVPAMKNITWLDGAGARVVADSGGMWFAAVKRDARVKKGDLLGYWTNYFGKAITGPERCRQACTEVRSPIDGVVTFIRGVPSMWPRATLANVAPILTEVPPWKSP